MSTFTGFLRRWPVLLVVPLLLLFSGLAWSRLCKKTPAIDDAYISFTYAKNIAAGHGFVYTPGHEKVQGSTSALWTYLAAAAFRWSAQPIFWLMIFNVAVVGGALVFFLAETDRLLRDSAPRFHPLSTCLLLAWIFAAPGFVVWATVTVLDTGLWIALILISFADLLRCARAERLPVVSLPLAILTPLMITSRPEAMLWIPVIVCLYGGLLGQKRRKWAPVLGALLAQGAWAAAWMAGLIWWRMRTFGYPLPNTYYAKVSGNRWQNLSEGAIYDLQFLSSNGFLILALVLLLLAVMRLLPGLIRKDAGTAPFDAAPAAVLAITSVFIGTSFLVPLATGGDHFSLFRFLQPAWPILGFAGLFAGQLLCSAKIAAMPRPGRLTVAFASIVAFAILAASNRSKWLPKIIDPKEYWGIEIDYTIAREGMTIARRLEKAFDPAQLPSVGVIVTGGIGYQYKGRILDLMGLNLPVMARYSRDRRGNKNHAAFAEPVFWDLQPEVVDPFVASGLLEVSPVKKYGFSVKVLKGVFDKPEFREKYSLLSIGSEKDGYVCGHFLNSITNRLRPSPGTAVYRWNPEKTVNELFLSPRALKSAVIFGATSAIAQAVATRLAAQGVEIMIVGRNSGRLAIVAEHLQVLTRQAVTVAVDAGDSASAAAIFATAQSRFATIDFVLLAQGSLPDQKMGEQDFAVVEEAFRSNVLNPTAILHFAAQIMETQRSGIIAVISSVAGDRGRQSNYIYGSAKAALDAVLSGLRNRLAPFGVHVLTVKPGFVDTPMTANFKKGPLFAKPETIADGILRAAAAKKDVIYLPAFWRLIMFIITSIPERIFKKLKL